MEDYKYLFKVVSLTSWIPFNICNFSIAILDQVPNELFFHTVAYLFSGFDWKCWSWENLFGQEVHSGKSSLFI